MLLRGWLPVNAGGGSEMTKQEAAAMLVQLYADYSILCDKYAWSPSDGMSEAVAIAVQSLQEVE